MENSRNNKLLIKTSVGGNTNISNLLHKTHLFLQNHLPIYQLTRSPSLDLPAHEKIFCITYYHNHICNDCDVTTLFWCDVSEDCSVGFVSVSSEKLESLRQKMHALKQVNVCFKYKNVYNCQNILQKYSNSLNSSRLKVFQKSKIKTVCASQNLHTTNKRLNLMIFLT